MKISCAPALRLAVTAAAATLIVTSVARAQLSLTVLHNNDGESKLLGNDVAGFGGAAFFATVLQSERAAANAAGRAVVTISSGDNFLAGKTYAASVDAGTSYDADVLSALQYDAITLGNHDFDFGPDVLADFIAEVTTGTYLAANLDFTTEPDLQALVTSGRIAKSVTVTKNGQQIGIIGVTTPTITNISSPRNVGVNANIAAVVQAEVNTLTAAGVKHIILSSHLQGIATEKALVAQLTGVDIVIAGGGDEILANPGDLLLPSQTPAEPYPALANDASGRAVPIVTTNGEYRYVGRLDVTFDANGDVTAAAGRPIRVARNDAASPPADAVAPVSALVTDVITPVANFVAALNANVIGQTQAALDGRRNPIRSVETNLGNLVADAFLRVAQGRAATFGVDSPQVALANGGGIRNNSLLAVGPLSEGTTFDVLAFSNFLSVVPNVPLATFKSILENALSQTARNATTGAIEPVGSNTGRFAQIAGFRVVYNLAAPATQLNATGGVLLDGSRVKDVFLDDGTALYLDGQPAPGAPASIDLATTDFIARGGDGYPFGGLPFVTLGITDQQSLQELIATRLGGVVSLASYSGPQARIVPLNLPLVVAPAPPATPSPLPIAVPTTVNVPRKIVNVPANARTVTLRGRASAGTRFVFVDGRLARGATNWTIKLPAPEGKTTRIRVRAANSAGQLSKPVTIRLRRSGQ